MLVVANHSSHVDFALISHALGEMGKGLVVLAAKDYFFNTPTRRFVVSNLTTLIPFDRERAQLESLDEALAELAAGRSVLLFPEGTRSPDGTMQEFKSGAGYLALRSGCEVLPIHISGHLSTCWARASLIPRYHPVEMRIGRVVSNAELRDRRGKLPRARVRIVRPPTSCARRSRTSRIRKSGPLNEPRANSPRMLTKQRRSRKTHGRGATPRARHRLLRYRRHIALVLSAMTIAIGARSASAWDSATHRAIARLAVEALPLSPLKTTLTRDQTALEVHAVEPDSVLKKRYGKAEDRRHYIDSEIFGSDPWSVLDPDFDKDAPPFRRT